MYFYDLHLFQTVKHQLLWQAAAHEWKPCRNPLLFRIIRECYASWGTRATIPEAHAHVKSISLIWVCMYFCQYASTHARVCVCVHICVYIQKHIHKCIQVGTVQHVMTYQRLAGHTPSQEAPRKHVCSLIGTCKHVSSTWTVTGSRNPRSSWLEWSQAWLMLAGGTGISVGM
jgi:hypothetical protein